MFGKIKLASGLLGVLAVFCLFLFAIEALGFWALASTRTGVDDLSNVAIAQVDGGSALVERAGDAMRTVSASITRVVQTMSEITAASVEQSVGIEQVNQAVTQMDQLTQQNAALVEEVAAAAASLNDQTSHLM